MYTLRPYQQVCVTKGVDFLRAPGNAHGLIVAPPGAGKSLIIASIVKELGEPCLVFQPTKEILEQNAAKLLAYGYEPAVYSASLNQRNTGDITLATIGSVKSLPEIFAGVRHVIVDEAHGVDAQGGMYKAFFDQLGDIKILGMTATPYRLSVDAYGGAMLKFLTRTRPKVFSEMVHYLQISDLMHQGYLLKPDYKIVSGFARSALTVNQAGSDYTDASVKRYYTRLGFEERLQRVVERLFAAGRRNTLVFTRFIEEAEALAAAVPGIAVVTGETPASVRAAIVSDFRSGSLKGVVNVNCLAVGFDYPELDSVVLARPTRSLALYYQQVGRVIRTAPGKTDAWVVDMVDQVAMFGKIEDLWLKPGGKLGKSWAITSNGRELTNVYLGAKPKKRFWKK